MRAMNPRIVVTVGPLKGKTFQITEEFTFGRLDGNDVNFEDDLVKLITARV